MRRFLSVSVFALLLASRAFSQGNNPRITLTENCVGNLVFPGGPPIAAPCAMIADPGPGGLASAMTYNLLGPPSLVAGDLILLEPGGGNSDLIRFNPAGTGNPAYPASVVFYSDQDGGIDNPADTGLPSALYTNVLSLAEVDLGGGLNGLVYTPTSSQPGFVAGFSVTYNLISDTPEPASIGLVLLGVGALLAKARRRS